MTFEETVQFVDDACDLCASERFAVFVVYNDVLNPATQTLRLRHICNDRNEVLLLAIDCVTFGRDFIVFPW